MSSSSGNFGRSSSSTRISTPSSACAPRRLYARLTDSTLAGSRRGRCTESRLRSRTTSTSRGSGRAPARRSSAPPPPEKTPRLSRRLRAAGAIVIGKNALYELAFGAQSECLATDPKPGRLGRATAGSSCGSAASVAAGLSFAALGSDTGGSIRVPAAFCGVVGIRPTAGTIPRDGLVRLSRLDEVGPLTRTAEDAALVFGVLCGRPSRGRRPDPDRWPPARCLRAWPGFAGDRGHGRWVL